MLKDTRNRSGIGKRSEKITAAVAAWHGRMLTKFGGIRISFLAEGALPFDYTKSMKPLFAAFLIAFSSFIANAGEQRPNIVLIMADDLSHRNLGCYGAVNFETPHLDKLAAGGMRFDSCFSMPLCTPSRVALMTGQHNGRSFFRASTLEANQRTFGDVAKAAGYATCVVGKWKLTGKSKESTPEQFGFDEHCVTEGLRNDSPRYKNPDILRNGKVEKHSGGEYGPDIVCDHAVDFIERSKDKPFLLYYPMVLVHSPLSPVPGSPGYDAADQRTDEKENYPDMVRRMDANVGRIVAKLDALGLRERTLVLFTGDNGSKHGVEMKLKDGTVYPGGKGNTSDSGVHVPLIVNQPGRVPIGVSDALVGFTDFLPTVADIAGAKLTNDIPCDGQSFLPHCLGKKDAASREWIFEWFCNNPQEDKVVEFAFDRDFRLYDDGRFYHWSADLAEEKPLDITSLDGAAKTAHAKLQSAIQTSRVGLNREKPKQSTAQSAPAAAKRPNILFIAIDDLRPEIGAYGVNRAVTPNIDKLAAKSLRFDRAYVTYPLCLPSRSSMLTGRRIDYSGPGKKRDFATLIQMQQTWPATFRKAGYWTATSGKLYHGSVPKVDTAAWDVPGEMWRNDFKDWSPDLMKKVVAEAGPKDVVEDFRKNGGGSGSLLSMAVDGDDDILTDGQTASIVTGYLRDRPKDKPFVICAGFSRPHMPWIAPKKYFDLYKDTKIELPKLPEGAKRELFKEDLGSGVSKDAAQWNEGVGDDEARELVKGYLASVSYSDAQVGRVLAALEESGQAENTIVILWGDHGYHLTEHGLWRKNTIYHIANRIPLLIHAPGKAAGVSQRLVESIDLYPTLLALTGTSADGLRLDGRSLVPLLEKPEAEWPHPAFIHANKDHGMVTDQYRYSNSNNGTEKLFDLRADPDEWHNLAADPAHAARVKQMRAAVEQAWKGDVVTDAPPPKAKAKGKRKQ